MNITKTVSYNDTFIASSHHAKSHFRRAYADIIKLTESYFMHIVTTWSLCLHKLFFAFRFEWEPNKNAEQKWKQMCVRFFCIRMHSVTFAIDIAAYIRFHYNRFFIFHVLETESVHWVVDRFHMVKKLGFWFNRIDIISVSSWSFAHIPTHFIQVNVRIFVIHLQISVIECPVYLQKNPFISSTEPGW